MNILVLIAVAFVAYFLFVLVFPKAIPEEKGKSMKAAMEQLYEENRAESVGNDILRDQIGSESVLIRTIFQTSLMKPLYELGLQAGFQQDIRRLLLLLIFVTAVILFASLLMGWLIIAILSPALGYYFVYSYCKRKIKRRNNDFINRFPDALDMIVRSVRSGFPLSTALQMLSENAEEPIKSEFRQVVDDLALGRSLTEALARLALRINEPDIRFFVVVLSVQQETGGNLSEIVNNLSGVIRKRKQLRMKIKAMTSEGRATGLILGALPVIVFGALSYVSPGYLEPFFNDSLGRILFMAVFGLLFTCFIVVKQMIKIDI